MAIVMGDGEDWPEDVPACFIIKLPDDRYVVCDATMLLHDDEKEFARELIDGYLRERTVLAAALPGHLRLCHYSGQTGR